MAINDGMQKLIQVVNRLHDAFTVSGLNFGLDLPQIAVVGGQSAGKSSVLENFVGRDFLPRGSGIVTRRPLILQLIHSNEEYGEFVHQPGRQYANFLDIRKEIEADTDRVTGKNKGISSKPINLKIYSPKVLDLTLIDLPGLTRVPVGDQPADIGAQIRQLVLSYISRESTLILAVSPANSDLATSDALQIAKEVDPDGNRTIGVLTKVDIMDHGTDARDILNNKVYPLKRGYVAVINRSQRDIDGNKNIVEALKAEEAFFRSHSKYSDIAQRQGTLYLQKLLNAELGRHIQRSMGSMRHILKTRLDEMQSELEGLQLSTTDKKANLMRLLQQFAEEVTTQIEGMTSHLDTDTLSAGARINRLFYTEFQDTLSLDKVPSKVLKKEISVAITNFHAIRNAIFTPDMPFEITVKRIVEKFRSPLHQCVDMAADILRATVLRSCDSVFRDYPLIQDRVTTMVKTQLQQQERITKAELATHIDAELAFMNTRHEDFIGRPQPALNRQIQADSGSETSAVVVLRKGIVQVNNKSLLRKGSGEVWMVLRTDAIEWYRDDKEQDQILSFATSGMRQKREKLVRIILFRADGRAVFADQRFIELGLRDQLETDAWSNAMKTADIALDEPVPEKPVPGAKWFINDNNESKPPPLLPPTPPERPDRNASSQKLQNHMLAEADKNKQEIDIILTMVESYLKIVSKTLRDMAPKYITLFLIKQTQKFIRNEIPVALLADDRVEEYMAISEDKMARQRDLDKMFKATQEALKIMSDTYVL